MKFIKAEQKEGKYKSYYFGIELEKTKDTTSILAVNGRDEDDIDIFDLATKEYNFKVIEKEKVEHCFTVATLNQENAFNKATIEVMQAKRNLDFCRKKMKEFFNI
jgi:hypothetical protein